MLKELMIKQDDVVYGETAAGANVSLDTIGSLAEGSIAAFTDDGQLILRTGAVATVANVDFTKPITIFAMENTLLRSITVLGKGRQEAFSDTAAAKIMTLDVDNFPTSRSEIKPTGVIIQDTDKNPHDPTFRKRAELPVDDDTTAVGAGEFEGDLATLIAAIDGVATAVGNGSGVITITLDAGRNLQFKATGYLEGTAVTVTQAIAYSNLLSAAEIAVLERETQAHQGNTHHDLMKSATDMFTKASMVESGLTYYTHFFKYIHHSAEYVDHGKEAVNVMCIASPDAVPGGSDADGTWAALIGSIADPASNMT